MKKIAVWLMVATFGLTQGWAWAAEVFRPLPNQLLRLSLSRLPDDVGEVWADMVEVDADSATEEFVAQMHAANKPVLCYINVGAYENWRADRGSFPASVIGNSYVGWRGEYWLDIRRIDIIGPIMAARMQRAKAKGCDGIDPDNMDSHLQKTGFAITRDHQLAYSQWLANTAHAMGLGIGQKNAQDLVPELVSYFDWALVESCSVGKWCGQMLPYAQAGKLVIQVEYDSGEIWLEDFCPDAVSHGFTAFITNRELDGWQEACAPTLGASIRVLDELEASDPTHFPAPGIPLIAEAYFARYYAKTGSYSGIRSGVLYTLTPKDGLQAIGEIQQLLPQ